MSILATLANALLPTRTGAIRNCVLWAAMQSHPPDRDLLESKYRRFDEYDIRELLKDSSQVMKDGYEIATKLTSVGKLAPFEDWKVVMKKKHGWINEKNLSRLYNQSCLAILR